MAPVPPVPLVPVPPAVPPAPAAPLVVSGLLPVVPPIAPLLEPVVPLVSLPGVVVVELVDELELPGDIAPLLGVVVVVSSFLLHAANDSATAAPIAIQSCLLITCSSLSVVTVVFGKSDTSRFTQRAYRDSDARRCNAGASA
jgi:hypothetical protein